MLNDLNTNQNPIYITKKKITKPSDFEHHKLIKTPSKFQLFKTNQAPQSKHGPEKRTGSVGAYGNMMGSRGEMNQQRGQ